MAYTQNTWKDRIGSGMNRWRDQNGNLLILTPDPESITEQGTPLSADWMNHIEQGIYDATKSYLTATNIIVPSAAWQSDPDTLYATYPYRAAVPVTGALATMIPIPAYSVDAVALGTLAPVSHPYNGGIYIYASAAPATAITLLSVVMMRTV